MRIISLLAMMFVAAAPAHAGDIALRVVDQAGNAVPDAVIAIRPAAGIPAGPVRFGWPATMVQKNIQFNPGTLIVAQGANVGFPNQDKVRHHVYSFAKTAKFEIKLFGRDETRSQIFLKAGPVPIGCNIHDTMRGFIFVTDTPFTAKTDTGGSTRITGVTGGKAQLTVWHPRMRAKDNVATFEIDMPGSGALSKRIQLALR